MSSPVGLFTTQLIRFFEDLKESFPEERDIKSALELIKFAKASNPKLVSDMFYEHVYKELNEPIKREDADYIIAYTHEKVKNEFNEISPALTIFDKYWATMTDESRNTIWKWLKVLCVLCERAKN
jgi:hypothetical protein